MRILDYARAAFRPDPAALAAGLTAVPVGRFGTFRYSGTPGMLGPHPCRRTDPDAYRLCGELPPVPVERAAELPPELADARLIDTNDPAGLATYPELAITAARRGTVRHAVMAAAEAGEVAR